MALKVLGQVEPSASTYTTLYTVPTGKSTVISTLSITNQAIVGVIKYRIAIRPGGATLATEHFIAYDTELSPYESTYITAGITLSAGDVVTVRSTASAVSFNLFGEES